MLADGRGVALTNLEGVVAYQDHAVPSRFYYTATRPRIARTGFDYQLSLVEYKRSLNGSAGTLSCIIDLEPSDDEMRELEDQLRALHNGPVQMEHIPWTSGTVTTVVRGGLPRTASPSLLGRNSAVLTVDLSNEQYALLTSALDRGDPNVVTVVYHLSYDVLRTTFEGRITFDQDKFRSWVQDRCSGGFLFISFESSSTFEELRNAGVIRVEVTDATESGLPRLRDAFMRTLQGIMGPEPQFAPTPQGDQWVLGFSCQHLTDEQRIRRAANVNLDVQAVEPRSMFLQAPLQGLVEAYRAAPRTPIDLDAGHFAQNVTFSCIASFGAAHLRTAIVTIAGPDQFSHAFDAADPQDWEVQLFHPPGNTQPYTYSVELLFADQTSIRGAATTIARDQSFIFVVASELYTLQRYAIEMADDFPWQLVSAVSVEVSPPASGQALPPAVDLVAEQPSGAVDIFVKPAWSIEPLAYQVTHNPSRSGACFTISGRSAGTTILLNGLDKREVLFEVDPTRDWSQVGSLTVSVRPPNGALTSDRKQLVLLKGRDSAIFTYWMYTPEQRALTYKLRYDLNHSSTPRILPEQSTTDTLVQLVPPDEH